MIRTIVWLVHSRGVIILWRGISLSTLLKSGALIDKCHGNLTTLDGCRLASLDKKSSVAAVRVKPAVEKQLRRRDSLQYCDMPGLNSARKEQKDNQQWIVNWLVGWRISSIVVTCSVAIPSEYHHHRLAF